MNNNILGSNSNLAEFKKTFTNELLNWKSDGIALLLSDFTNLGYLCDDSEFSKKVLVTMIVELIVKDKIMNFKRGHKAPVNKYLIANIEKIVLSWCFSLPYFRASWNFLGEKQNIRLFRNNALTILQHQIAICNEVHSICCIKAPNLVNDAVTTITITTILSDGVNSKKDSKLVHLTIPIQVFDTHSDESMNLSYAEQGKILLSNTVTINNFIQDHMPVLAENRNSKHEKIFELLKEITDLMQVPIETALPYPVNMSNLHVVELRHKHSVLLLETVNNNLPMFISNISRKLADFNNIQS